MITDLLSLNSPKINFFCAAILHPSIVFFFLILRPLLKITFPQGFRFSKNIGHPTSRSGAKRCLSGRSKVNTRTICPPPHVFWNPPPTKKVWTPSKKKCWPEKEKLPLPLKKKGFPQKKNVTAKKKYYWWFYLHRLRDSVSPICGIFFWYCNFRQI